jgi:peroxiredoxin
MKYYYPVLFIIILLTGCGRSKHIEFTGTVTGFKNGYFIIKGPSGNNVFTGTIQDGKFDVKNMLDTTGYYTMDIIADSYQDHPHKGYDVYLEPGTYTITGGPEELYSYPVIKSSSEIQNQLSDYYAMANAKLSEAAQKVAVISNLMGDKKMLALSGKNYEDVLNDMNKAVKDENKVQSTVLESFVDKYQQNKVADHIMYQQNYAADPTDYYRIYNKFTPEEKNSDEGKEEGEKLGGLMKLAPGAIAPQLVGKTPDGKTFDPASLKKKIILVEFWRSDVESSRINHNDLLRDSFSPLSNKEFTIISVSLDKEKNAWTDAIKADRMAWPQISDLKGEDSPNMANWEISAIPTYYLLDGNWHIIQREIPFHDIAVTVDDYLHKAK